MRVAFRGGALAEGGALFTVLTALGVVAAGCALAQGGPLARDVWPFLLAGLLEPGHLAVPVHVRGARGGCVADVGRHRHGAALLGRDRGRRPRRAARGSARRRRRADRGRRVPSRQRARATRARSAASGSCLALAATIVFASATTSFAGSSVDTDVIAWRRGARDAAAGAAMMAAFVARGRAPLRRARRSRVRARGSAVRPLLRLPLRGLLPRSRDRRVAARRDRVALGRHAVVARSAAVESVVGCGLFAGAALVVCGGVLIGLNY